MAKNQPKPHDATQGVLSMQQVEMKHSGPLPPASEFARYNEVCPGAAEVILQMAQKEQEHRHKAELELLAAEREDIKLTHRENCLAYWLAFVVVLAFLICGFTLTMYNHDKVGGTMMGVGLVGVIASFLRKKK